MAIYSEFPIKTVILHSYVSLPEGSLFVSQSWYVLTPFLVNNDVIWCYLMLSDVIWCYLACVPSKAAGDKIHRDDCAYLIHLYLVLDRLPN